MAINKVVYGNQTLMDLTSDTVTEQDVAQGKTFHDASGMLRTGSGGGGTASSVTYDNTSSGLTATNVQDAIDEVVDTKANQSLIAPVLTSFIATASIKDKGTQFIYEGTLYEITTSVTAGTTFVVGTNVKVSDSVTEQEAITTYETVFSNSSVVSATTYSLNKDISNYKYAIVKTSRASCYLDLRLMKVYGSLPFTCCFNKNGGYEDTMQGTLTASTIQVSNRFLAGWGSSTVTVIVFK